MAQLGSTGRAVTSALSINRRNILHSQIKLFSCSHVNVVLREKFPSFASLVTQPCYLDIKPQTCESGTCVNFLPPLCDAALDLRVTTYARSALLHSDWSSGKWKWHEPRWRWTTEKSDERIEQQEIQLHNSVHLFTRRDCFKPDFCIIFGQLSSMRWETA